MAKLSLYARKRVISLKSAGNSYKKIQEVLLDEGINISIAAMSLFLSRYWKTGHLNDARWSGRKLKLRQHVDYMDEKDERKWRIDFTGIERKGCQRLRHGCVNSDNSTSKAKIRLEERECKVVHQPNKMKWLAFCLKALSEKEKFENIIFKNQHANWITC